MSSGQPYPQRQPQQPAGMFGSMGGATQWTPTPSAFGPQAYDVSGISRGAQMLQNAPQYKPTSYKPYQFSAGRYGTTDPKMMKDIYEQALGVAERPIRASGTERMRQMGQGFEGGRFTGAAQREAAMKTGQETGSQVQDVAAGIGSQLSQARLGELQTARQAQYGAEQDRQRQQAAEQFQTAGFGDAQSRYMAEQGLAQAQAMMGYGFQLPQMQQQLSQQQQAAFQNILNQMSTLGGLG